MVVFFAWIWRFRSGFAWVISALGGCFLYGFTAPNAPEPYDIKVSGYQWFGLPDFSPFNMRLGLERAGPVLKEYLGSQMIKYQLSPQDLAL